MGILGFGFWILDYNSLPKTVLMNLKYIEGSGVNTCRLRVDPPNPP